MTPSTATAAKRAATSNHSPPVTPVSAEQIAQWPYRFAVVPLKHLFMDAYQRPLTSFVKRIENNFNPALIGTLCLSERSKTKYAVIDGQTRAEGMRRLGMTEAPALVFENLTREQEAELFALFQTERRSMTSADRFKAQVIAGDPMAVEISEVLEGLGFKIDHNSNEPGALRATAAIEYVFHGAGVGKRAKAVRDPELLARVLETIRAAWPKLPDTAKSKVMLRGLGYYLKHNPDTDLDRLSNRLGKVTPTVLAKRAEALREGRGMSAGDRPADMAEAIDSVYRKR